ncbi:MAG TPA: cysteine peptidase family C39 domain-containing protein [Planctomycetota bacterium]|nr:cysteine peptidase family C39 domain-containing protein [Planctomycetota bacterium]
MEMIPERGSGRCLGLPQHDAPGDGGTPSGRLARPAPLALLWNLGLAVAVLGSLLGCTYLGTARTFDPADWDASPGWIAIHTVPFQEQHEESQCGLAALRMIFDYWNVEGWTRARMKPYCPVVNQKGIRARDLRRCARAAGLECYLIQGTWGDLVRELELGHPVIVGLVKPTLWGPLTHYEVVVGIHPDQRLLVTLDPARGWRLNTEEGFQNEWNPASRLLLVFLSKTDPAIAVPTVE